MPKKQINQDLNSYIHSLNDKQTNQKKRRRKSKLDSYLPFILEKANSGWSHQRILDTLNHEHQLNLKHRSAISRRIKRFFDEK